MNITETTSYGYYICVNCHKLINYDIIHECTISNTIPQETAKKFDIDKIPLELLSPIALNKIAEVLQFGAKKYDAHNWRNGLKWSKLLGALLRHTLAFMNGQDKDPESGLSHLAHAGCCIMFLLEQEITHKDKDDRYKISIENVSKK